ncbi:MAG: response regulator [Thermodesulfobacteriota bacterium]|nr:response regulator [Thermodesulfobacteriota bacterium]
MKIYTKIMITLLPLMFIFLLSLSYITYHLSSKALTTLAETWLSTSLTRGMKVLDQQQTNLEKYQLDQIAASISKAKMDADKAISSLKLGGKGYFFAVNTHGIVTVHPDKTMTGKTIKNHKWFSRLKEKNGRLVYNFKNKQHLAVYDFFEPWGWYVFATDPKEDYYGTAARIKTICLISSVIGSALLAAFLLLCTRALISRPLIPLIKGSQRIGKGNLNTRIPVLSNDEFGMLARSFNAMTEDLQEVTVSKNALEKEINKRIKKQEELNSTKKQLTATLDALPDILVKVDRRGYIQKIRAPENELFFKDCGSFSDRHLMDVFPEDVVITIQRAMENALDKKSHTGSYFYLSTPSGQRCFELSMAKTGEAKNEDCVFIILMRDITARKLAEKKVAEIADRFQKMLDAIPDMISIHDAQYNIVYSNWNGVGNVPEEKQQVFTKCYHTYYGRKKRCINCHAQNVIKTKTQYETEEKLSDGRWLRIIVIPLMDDNNDIDLFMTWIRDITEQKKFKDSISEVQRMKTVGTLAGGIAHNFNNILMGIQGNCTLIKLGKDPSHRDITRIERIEKSINDATFLTRQLLGFARGGQYNPLPMDLNHILEEQTRMFEQTKKSVVIKRNYHTPLHTVELERGQIEQVLLNLYINACEAMTGQKEEIFLKTEKTLIDKTPFKIKPGKYVKISIADTGKGMDKKTCRRIFEPFFTTKTMTRGTGLGLSSTYGIVKGHGGFINVYSETGMGTTFTIYLPASDKTLCTETDMIPETEKGQGTILLVDDEKEILDISTELLQELNYQVISAKSGKAAIDVFKKKREAISLVILDMIMPDMDGEETFKTLKKIDPRVKVVLSSGYSIDGQARHILDMGCQGFIQKPFTLNILSQKIKRNLGN